jgi:ADP-glucose pyrophosphorylase
VFYALTATKGWFFNEGVLNMTVSVVRLTIPDAIRRWRNANPNFRYHTDILLTRIGQSEIVIDSNLHLTNLDLGNALGRKVHQNIIVGSTSVVAVKEKRLAYLCGSIAALD